MLSPVFTREGAVSSWGQSVLTMVDAMMRKLKWEPKGLDPPSQSDLAIRWGRGHSMETQQVTCTDGRVMHMTEDA